MVFFDDYAVSPFTLTAGRFAVAFEPVALYRLVPVVDSDRARGFERTVGIDG